MSGNLDAKGDKGVSTESSRSLSELLKQNDSNINHFNPYIVGAPVPPDKFYGRQQLIGAILAAIKAKNHVAIYGERRIGKTSLLHLLEYLLREKTDTVFIPLFIQMQMISEARFFAALIDAVLKSTPTSIKESFPPLIRQISSSPYEALDLLSDLETVIKAWNNELEKPMQLIFLLDEGDRLNQFSEATQMQLRGLLQDAFINQYVRLVWCGVGIDRAWHSATSPWFNLFKTEFHVDSLKSEEARRLILEPVAGVYHYEKKAVAKILELTESKPYSIQWLCSSCIDHIQTQDIKRSRVTLRDVGVVWAKNKNEGEITQLSKLARSQAQVQTSESLALADLRLRQREYLLEIGRAISARLDLAALLKLTLQSAVEIIAGQAGLITLRQADNSFIPYASIGLPIQAVPLFEPLWRDLEAEESQGVIPDISLRLDLASKAAGVPMRQVVALPLEIGMEIIGYIFIFRDQGAAFSSNDREILSAFADQAVIAKQNADLYQQINTENDPLKVIAENNAEYTTTEDSSL